MHRDVSQLDCPTATAGGSDMNLIAARGQLGRSALAGSG